MIQRIRAGGLVAFIILVVIVVVGLAIYGEQQVTSLKTPALVLTQQVLPGQVINQSDVTTVHIALGGQTVSLMSSLPANAIASVPLNPGVLLQASDLAQGNTAQVSIAIQHSPAISPGDTVDIYLNDTGTTVSPGSLNGSGTSSTPTPPGVILIGVGIPVTAVNGTTLTLLVPFSQATSWAAISAAAPQLVGVTASTRNAPSVTQTDLNAALQVLESTVGSTSGG
jgi:hypothetical protein